MIAQQDPIGWPAAILTAGVVSALLVGSGLLVVAVAERAADGRLGRNAIAGIRTRTTRASDEAWLAAHRAGKRPTALGGYVSMVTGPVSIIVGLLLAVVDDGDAATFLVWWTVVLMLGVATMTAAVIHGAVVGQRAARAVNEGGPLAG